MHRRLLGAACLTAALLAAPALAQTRPGLVSFQRLALPDDVPAGLSSAIAQDTQGFLWFGTQDGLVRYDGYGFRTYRAAPGQPAALSGSYIRTLLATPDGRLWAGTMSGGLSVYDPRTDAFTRYRHHAGDPASLAHDHVEALAADARGGIWIGTDAGLDRLDPASGALTHVRRGEQVRALRLDRRGTLWVGTRTGLYAWQGDRAVAAGALAGEEITQLFLDRRGRLWIGTARHGAAVLDPERGSVTRLPPGPEGLSHFWVHGFAELADGEVWVATFGGGIDVVDGTALRVIDRLRRDSASASTLGSDRIGALLVDRSGIAWVGTWGGGVARHDPSTRAFRKLRYLAAPDAPLSHPEVVRALETADGRLWLGTNGNGIDVLDAGGRRVASYRPGQLANGSISCLAQGPDGSVWAATLDGSLHRLRAGGAGIARLGPAQGLPGGPIRSMVFGPDGALWAGSANGLARIETNGTITRYVHRDDDPGSLSGGGVESLAFTRDGTLWVGTEDGLNAFDPRRGRAVRVLHDAQRADSLPDNWVPDLLTARDGTLWAATQAGAARLTAWDGRSAHFELAGARLGLPPRPADSLIEDLQGQIWVGARLRIDPATWTSQSFGPADGNEFRTLFIASRARTRRGELLFGSPEGLLIVDPGHLPAWRYQPPLALSSLRIDGHALDGGGGARALTLEPNQRDLRLEFAALDFSAPQQLKYRYRLEGYDPDWVNVDAGQRIAAYTGLPPGDYRLRIQGSNRAGAWSPLEWKLALTVKPAFWQTWWFRLAALAAAGLAIAGVFRLRLAQLHRRGELLERQVAERTSDLAAAYQRIEEASLTDPLTGLRNRRFLEQAIQADLELCARRHRQQPPEPASDLMLLMLDLDHFKQVNDVYGHAAGDAVLTQTARVLTACMRASDYVVRWGGEEFLLVARFVDRAQGALLAEKIRQAVADHPFALPDGSVLRKTVSIGYAAYPFVPGLPGAVTLESLQRIADTALYAAKRSWRDAWVGVAVGQAADGDDIDSAVRHFLADAAASVARGEMEAVAAPHPTAMRWQ